LRILPFVGGALVLGVSCGSSRAVLEEAWKTYIARFIQADGRVIDHKGGDISTSEGQAYAMLRAVWMRDRETFEKAFAWAEANLNHGVRDDHLWAWKWGKGADGSWRVLDKAFASDADEDAALALLLASARWKDSTYTGQARSHLADLFDRGTIVAGGRRFLLSGDTLCDLKTCRLNPSYYAPYAYRIFARLDPERDWGSLVDTSYFLLEEASAKTTTGLPPDWLLLDKETGDLRLGSEVDSRYSYDAFRVHWRVALDEALFHDPRATAYLSRSLAWLSARLLRDSKLPAVISKDGTPAADYESLEMLAAVLPALKKDAARVIQGKLKKSFHDGLWGDPTSYYIQNWVWFGTVLEEGELSPFESVR
jgi:endoglucanase